MIYCKGIEELLEACKEAYHILYWKSTEDELGNCEEMLERIIKKYDKPNEESER